MTLQSVPAHVIVRAIADAARRWTDADFPTRVRATTRIAERTRYSVPVVEFALDSLFASITEEALGSVIENELGPLDILDGFAPRAGRTDAWARAVGRVCIVASRTTVGVAIPPSVFALCAKCTVDVKDREDGLAAAFFETLREELPELGGTATAAAWPAGQQEDFFTRCDAAVVFGDDATLRELRERVPASARFIGFGSRASAGYVACATFSDPATRIATARGAARDAVLYDAEGCLSLHLLFVQRGDGMDAFLAELRAAIAAARVEFPPVDDPAAVAAKAHRGAYALFASAMHTPATPALLDDPPRIITVNDAAEAVRYVKDQEIPLEACALAPMSDELIAAAVETGAVRVTAFGELQRPLPQGNHGGRARIADFVQWVERAR